MSQALELPQQNQENLYDDLSRRDFTINAMAKDPDTGEIIDYFYGKHDIKNALIRTPR